MKKYLFVVFALVVFIYSKSFAGELTWDEVYSRALKNNPEIHNARKTLQLAEISYRNSLLNYAPSLSATASAGKSSSREISYSYGISGRLDLFKGFKNINESRIKERSLTMQEAILKRYLADFTAGLRLAYAELLKTRLTIDLLEDITDRRKNNLELVRLRYDAGRENRGAYLRSEADYFQAQFETRREKRDYETDRAQLLKKMGEDIYADIDVTGTFKVPSVEKRPATELLALNPDYQIAKYRAEISGLELKQNYGTLYPSLGLSGSISRSGDSWPPEGESWSAGLSLSHSLLSGGRDILSLKSASINKSIALNNLENRERELLIGIERAYNNLLDAVESYEVRERYYNARRERSEISKEKYINGLMSYQDWDSIENEFINVQKSMLEARYSLFAAWANWLKTTGREK